jgi:PKD repeat protein
VTGVTGQGAGDAFTAPGRVLSARTDSGLTLEIDGVVDPTLPFPNSAPTARVNTSTSSAPVGQPITFDASGSTDPNNDPLSYNWDFGDGSTGMGTQIQHSYATAGTYNVTLTAEDTVGATGMATATVTATSNAPENGNGGDNGTQDPENGGGQEDNTFEEFGTRLLAALAAGVIIREVLD